MPSGFSSCLQKGNELYQSPSSKGFTCSSLTSRDYVPLSGDSMPVHQDLMPVHQDLTPVYQDSMPFCQDLTPVYQESTPVIRISCLFVRISCLLLKIYPFSKTFLLHQSQFLRFISLLFQKDWFPYYMIKSTIEKFKC